MTDYEYFGEDAEESTEFVIDNDRLANWACRKIKEETAEHDRLVEIAKAEIEEINKKVALIDQQLESRTGFLKSKLYDYFQKVDHKETKTQENYKLLDGSLVWKKPSIKIKKPDDDKLLAVLEKVDILEEFVETIKKPKWAEFKKTLNIADGQIVDEYGDIIEGLELEETPGSFDIK